MRETLSTILVNKAKEDSRFITLCGDHGYVLFDRIRAERPKQYLNTGIIEPSMVCIASGLAIKGFRPLVYGLASFVPMRVLEQIKLSVAYAKLPVIFIGDGAGLTYSTLGASHQCAEDIGCMATLPNMRIYSPANSDELKLCFEDAYNSNGPAYIRTCVSRGTFDSTSLPTHMVHFGRNKRVCLVAHGSRVEVAHQVGKALDLSVISVPQIKPLDTTALKNFESLIVIEEHSPYGGLASMIQEAKEVHSVCLPDEFVYECGSHDYVLARQGLGYEQVLEKVRALI